MIGSYALDLSPTKHVVMMLIAALLACIILINAARAQARHAAKGEAPRGLSGTVEAMVLYIRNEVILPAVGPHGDTFVPYLLTVFFFILFANLLGLVPVRLDSDGQRLRDGDACDHRVLRDRDLGDARARQELHQHDRLLAARHAAHREDR